jgi:hypothetical protein
MPILAGCTTTSALSPPSDRLVCKAEPDGVALPPVDWAAPVTAIRSIVNAREFATATYMLALRDAGQDCRSQLGWNRDYWQGQK